MRGIIIGLSLALCAAPALAGPASVPSRAEGEGDTAGIAVIDARTLTMAELLALAAAERAAPSPLSCCDWGSNCSWAHLDRSATGPERRAGGGTSARAGQ